MKHKNRMTPFKLLAIIFLGMPVLISACSTAGSKVPEMPTQNSARQALTEKNIANAVYRLDSVGEFRLDQGKFVRSYGEGMTQRHQVTLEKAAVGDLNRDGREDAAVVLAVQSGGTGTFRYLIAMQDTGDALHQQNTVLLGDHIDIRDLSVSAGQVLLEMLQPTPKNPVCCPTQRVKQIFNLQDGKWVRISNQTIDSTIPLDSKVKITGIVWEWERYEDPFHSNNFEIEEPHQYTLIFLTDGSYQVKADCNRMQGKYTREGASLKIVPGAATLAECGPESHYVDFLKDLTDAVSFEMQDNKLVLNLVMGGERLIFRNGGRSLGK